ncbi:MAG: hypothetical protein ACREMJ_01015, partial [Gemmatimonadales bacterium]
PMLGAVLAHTAVAGAQGETLVIRLLDENPVHADGIERQRDALTRLVARYVSGPVRVRVERGPGSGEPPATRPSRLTDESAKGERLKVLRAKDATLSAAVDALDLELLE